MSRTTIKEDITKKAAYDMLYLAGCGIKGISPQKNRVTDMELSAVRAMSRRHSLEAITCTALEPLFPDKANRSDTFKKWQEDKNKAVRKELLLDAERSKLISFMEEKGIWHTVLKGIIFKKMYPKIGMRQMSDNDILCDKAFQTEICEWFKANGYTVVSFNKAHHDVYHKEPIYNFEPTWYLFDESFGVLNKYYKNIRDRLLPQDGTKYGFRFTDEDFYIYFIAHAYVHSALGGTGARSLLDCYVFLNAKNGSLDWAYLHSELEKTELRGFESRLRETALAVFTDPESFSSENLSRENEEQLEYMLASGTYGTLENLLNNKLETLKKYDGEALWRAKLRYVRLRIFPPMSYYKTAYPFLYRNRFFIPFFVVYRIISCLFANGKHIIAEIRFLKKKKK